MQHLPAGEQQSLQKPKEDAVKRPMFLMDLYPPPLSSSRQQQQQQRTPKDSQSYSSSSGHDRIFLKFVNHFMVRNKYCRVCKQMISYFETASKLSHCKHFIHYSCLLPLLLENGTNQCGCVSCCEDIFEPEDGMVREHVDLNVTYQLSLDMCHCSFCGFNIYLNDPCMESSKCPHFLHAHCLLESVRRDGLSISGDILCKLCKM